MKPLCDRHGSPSYFYGPLSDRSGRKVVKCPSWVCHRPTIARTRSPGFLSPVRTIHGKSGSPRQLELRGPFPECAKSHPRRAQPSNHLGLLNPTPTCQKSQKPAFIAEAASKPTINTSQSNGEPSQTNGRRSVGRPSSTTQDPRKDVTRLSTRSYEKAVPSTPVAAARFKARGTGGRSIEANPPSTPYRI